ncbi:hypothetical protein [Neobacillus mesonae]|nr:hypothetical protein [Neobacillus mesonae]
MEKENKEILYLHMILATIGAIIIPLTAILNAKIVTIMKLHLFYLVLHYY